MFRIDDMKKFETPMHRRSEPTGESQQLMVVNRRVCYANPDDRSLATFRHA